MKFTATDGGMYEVRVNGVAVSQHTAWWKATEALLLRKRENPTDKVTIFLAQEIRVEALAEPEPEPVPPPVVVWRWDATTIAPFGIHAKDPSRVTLVNVGGSIGPTGGVGGRPAVRLLTMPGDSNVFGSGLWERSDLRLGNAETDASEGKKQRWFHSVWLGDDYTDLPQSPANAQPWYGGLLMNFHNTADKGGQANAQLAVYPPTATDPGRPTGLHFRIHGGDFANPVKGEYPLGPIVRNKWLDFEYDVLWTSLAHGYFKCKMNGQPMFEHFGPTLYHGESAYLKFANYHTAYPVPGNASAVHHGPAWRTA